MDRILFALFVLFTATGCKTEKKELTAKDEPEVIKKANSKVYPKIEYESEMNIAYDDKYLFDEKIQLDQISVENIGKDIYDLVLYFNESTDFEMLEKYKISLILYPKNPDELAIEKERIAKQKKRAAMAEIKILDNEHVVVIDSIKVLPKEFNKIKISLYNNSEGTLNDNFLILSDIVF